MLSANHIHPRNNHPSTNPFEADTSIRGPACDPHFHNNHTPRIRCGAAHSRDPTNFRASRGQGHAPAALLASAAASAALAEMVAEVALVGVGRAAVAAAAAAAVR